MTNPSFVKLVKEQMACLGDVQCRAMFGGYGFFVNDIMFAILVNDGLYFKSDGQSQTSFQSRGLQPFQYQRQGKWVTLSFWQAPAEVLEEEEAMIHWGELALAAAHRAKKGVNK